MRLDDFFNLLQEQSTEMADTTTDIASTGKVEAPVPSHAIPNAKFSTMATELAKYAKNSVSSVKQRNRVPPHRGRSQ